MIPPVTFFVSGDPVPKQSFRKTKNGGYIPVRVKAWADTVSWKARETIKTPITGQVHVKLFFYLKNNRVVDLDNLSKNVLDGLKNIAFGDDSEVTKLVLTKAIRKDDPGVMIVISEAE